MKHYIPPTITIEFMLSESIMETSIPLNNDDSEDPSEALIGERTNDYTW